MNFNFYIENEVVNLSHDKMFGSAKLSDGVNVVKLVSAINVADQIRQQGLTVNWAANWKGHNVVVQRKRPLLFSNFRKMNYKIWVDDNFVLEIDA